MENFNEKIWDKTEGWSSQLQKYVLRLRELCRFIPFNRFRSIKSKFCDYRFHSTELTNQSTSIDYYRVLSINRVAFR